MIINALYFATIMAIIAVSVVGHRYLNCLTVGTVLAMNAMKSNACLIALKRN